jgi:hypothetical protein
LTVTANSSTKYFVAEQQCSVSPLLHFHGNTEKFYIVDSYVCANQKKMERIVAYGGGEFLCERDTR